MDFQPHFVEKASFHFTIRICHLKVVIKGLAYIHIAKMLSIFFSVTKAYTKSHFRSSDRTDFFRASVWKICLDVAKIIEVWRISFLSYGGYNVSYLNIFNFPKCMFAYSILHSTEDNFGKQS